VFFFSKIILSKNEVVESVSEAYQLQKIVQGVAGISKKKLVIFDVLFEN
jgi:hypothetical protein